MSGGVETHRVQLTRKRGAHRLSLPQHLLVRFGLSPKGVTRIRLGKRRVRVRVEACRPDEDPKLSLGRGALQPPPGWSIHLQGGRELAAGPVVGIMAEFRNNGFFGAQTSLFRRLCRIGEQMGVLVFAFVPSAASFSRGLVRGHTYAGGRWRRVRMPFPDVVFDRALRTRFTRAVERRLVREYGVRWFNSDLSSKWRQHRLLRKDPGLAEHLLVTRPMRSVRDLAVVVRRYGGAYVKPTLGGKGIGICRVEAVRRGYRCWCTNRRSRARRFRSRSLRRVYRAVRRVRRRQIVQQRIRLLQIKGRILDVRVLVQRDWQGEWQVTGSGVRLGRRGSIVSNLFGGARPMRLKEVLESQFDPVRAAELVTKIEDVALRMAAAFDRGCTCLGELGIDIGLDRHGGIWFIEANARAGRLLFHRTGTPEVAAAADRRPLEFAAYLAGFGEAVAVRTPAIRRT